MRVQSKEFKAWFAENKSWLKPYAIFGFLRDLHGTSEHWRWGTLSNPTPEVHSQIPAIHAVKSLCFCIGKLSK